MSDYQVYSTVDFDSRYIFPEHIESGFKIWMNIPHDIMGKECSEGFFAMLYEKFIIGMTKINNHIYKSQAHSITTHSDGNPWSTQQMVESIF